MIHVQSILISYFDFYTDFWKQGLSPLGSWQRFLGSACGWGRAEGCQLLTPSSTLYVQQYQYNTYEYQIKSSILVCVFLNSCSVFFSFSFFILETFEKRGCHLLVLGNDFLEVLMGEGEKEGLRSADEGLRLLAIQHHAVLPKVLIHTQNAQLQRPVPAGSIVRLRGVASPHLPPPQYLGFKPQLLRTGGGDYVALAPQFVTDRPIVKASTILDYWCRQRIEFPRLV